MGVATSVATETFDSSLGNGKPGPFSQTRVYGFDGFQTRVPGNPGFRWSYPRNWRKVTWVSRRVDCQLLVVSDGRHWLCLCMVIYLFMYSLRRLFICMQLYILAD